MTATDSTANLVERLKKLDVCAVSDAMDALKIAGSLLGLPPIWEGAKVVGPARTVTVLEGTAPADRPPLHLGVRAIEASEPGDVIVVSNGGRIGMGAWGGLLSFAASVKQVAGVVVDGAFRDVDEARELGFPGFARAGVQRTARGRVYEEASGEPIEIDGVTVRPGDLVMADGSGVVVVPRDRADEVVARAEDIVAREVVMKTGLSDGVAVSKVLDGSYESMLKA